jgi:hypothetical protein
MKARASKMGAAFLDVERPETEDPSQEFSRLFADFDRDADMRHTTNLDHRFAHFLPLLPSLREPAINLFHYRNYTNMVNI